MVLIHSLAEQYAAYCTSSPDLLQEAVATRTEASHPRASMMSSRVQGKFLEIFSTLLQPKAILEVGTFTGFSGLCLAKGLQEGGRLHTIELQAKDAETARSNFNQSKYADKIILHLGNALEIIPGLNETWDLAFIDADKTGYVEYYELILPKMRNGGVILADNVLFHGEVLAEPVTSKNGKAMGAFNEHVRNDDRVEQVMLTMRDGLTIIRKK